MLNEDNAEKKVTLLSRTEAYKGKVVTVYDDYVDVGGRKTHWDFIHHPGAAAVLPVADDGQILMVRQYRNALGRFMLELPAGKRDSEDEDYLLCAKRELEEETGYCSDDFEFLIRINTTVALLDEQIDIFVARNLQKGERHWDEDEELGLEKWALEDLKALIYKGELTDSKTVSAILAYAEKFGL